MKDDNEMLEREIIQSVLIDEAEKLEEKLTKRLARSNTPEVPQRIDLICKHANSAGPSTARSVLERNEDVRAYLDSRWKNRPTQLWPAQNQPWDHELQHKLKPPYGYNRKMSAKEQVATWTRILDDHEMEQAVLFPTGAANIVMLQETDFAIDVSRAGLTDILYLQDFCAEIRGRVPGSGVGDR